MFLSQISQLDYTTVENYTQLAAREGLALVISIVSLIVFVIHNIVQFNRIAKTLTNIEKNTKGYISDSALKDVLKIYISDIRNKEQSFIYHKIEKNSISENFEYIKEEIYTEAQSQVNEKREALAHLTTYNNISQFSFVTEKNLTWHIENIKKSFEEELKKDKIDYKELKNISNKELTLFEKETTNQLNKLF